jgi:glycogen synthase
MSTAVENTAQSNVDICMFVHNDVTSDGRVLKEAASLAAQGWKVVVVGIALGQKESAEVEIVSNFTIIRVRPRLFRRALPGTLGKLLRLIIAIPSTAQKLRQTHAHVYHGNDFIGLLMLALAGIWRRPIVYDAHELFFDRFPIGLFNYPLKYVIWTMRPLEKILARQAAAVITVGDAVANRLAETLHIPLPVVVRNAVDPHEFTLPVPIERSNGQQIIAHSGVLLDGRHLPQLVESLTLLPSNICLALIGDGILRTSLVEQARQLGIGDRLLTIFPVTPHNITPTLAQADVAIMLITSKRLSYHLSLPNKFFEAVAAGIPIVSSPIPEVAAFIKKYDFGVLCDPIDPASIAKAIMQVLEPDNYARYKANAISARSEFTWEGESQKLIALYQRILTGK